eukprot:CAMPEP_0184693028 /NCGR_PEP_ID=MMETSP0313-20130426/1334_1 /TAXON_ID=2792 /ORGANISM="Porphyridium aerugineum, Strain SAG 1380-2" /LENGTH=547 /DNA_ID=CAMNT_0027150977 /DNA_START=210 /DNA_END=1853 /DNA_ORIENTATION=-
MAISATSFPIWTLNNDLLRKVVGMIDIKSRFELACTCKDMKGAVWQLEDVLRDHQVTLRMDVPKIPKTATMVEGTFMPMSKQSIYQAISMEVKATEGEAAYKHRLILWSFLRKERIYIDLTGLDFYHHRLAPTVKTMPGENRCIVRCSCPSMHVFDIHSGKLLFNLNLPTEGSFPYFNSDKGYLAVVDCSEDGQLIYAGIDMAPYGIVVWKLDPDITKQTVDVTGTRAAAGDAWFRQIQVSKHLNLILAIERYKKTADGNGVVVPPLWNCFVFDLSNLRLIAQIKLSTKLITENVLYLSTVVTLIDYKDNVLTICINRNGDAAPVVVQRYSIGPDPTTTVLLNEFRIGRQSSPSLVYHLWRSDQHGVCLLANPANCSGLSMIHLRDGVDVENLSHIEPTPGAYIAKGDIQLFKSGSLMPSTGDIPLDLGSCQYRIKRDSFAFLFVNECSPNNTNGNLIIWGNLCKTDYTVNVIRESFELLVGPAPADGEPYIPAAPNTDNNGYQGEDFDEEEEQEDDDGDEVDEEEEEDDEEDEEDYDAGMDPVPGE